MQSPESDDGKLNGKKSHFAFLGLPSDIGGITASGQAEAPRYLRYLSDNSDGIFPNTKKSSSIKNIVDCGDIYVGPIDIEEYISTAIPIITRVARNTNCLIAVGGDDSVSYAVGAGLYNAHGDISLIHYDAHTDTYGQSKDTITHGNWVWHLKNDYGIPVQQYGCRSVSDIGPICDRIQVGSKVFLSIDIDVVDPAFAPGVACPSSFGMTSRELLAGLESVINMYTVVGIAINEMVVTKDINSQTGILVKDIIVRLMAYMQEHDT